MAIPTGFNKIIIMSTLFIGIAKAETTEDYTVLILLRRTDNGGIHFIDHHLIKAPTDFEKLIVLNTITKDWAFRYNEGIIINWLDARP